MNVGESLPDDWSVDRKLTRDPKRPTARQFDRIFDQAIETLVACDRPTTTQRLQAQWSEGVRSARVEHQSASAEHRGPMTDRRDVRIREMVDEKMRTLQRIAVDAARVKEIDDSLRPKSREDADLIASVSLDGLLCENPACESAIVSGKGEDRLKRFQGIGPKLCQRCYTQARRHHHPQMSPPD